MFRLAGTLLITANHLRQKMLVVGFDLVAGSHFYNLMNIVERLGQVRISD